MNKGGEGERPSGNDDFAYLAPPFERLRFQQQQQQEQQISPERDAGQLDTGYGGNGGGVHHLASPSIPTGDGEDPLQTDDDYYLRWAIYDCF
jgi:hypothetical protein